MINEIEKHQLDSHFSFFIFLRQVGGKKANLAIGKLAKFYSEIFVKYKILHQHIFMTKTHLRQ